ncbi:haloacid dehalogenase type II [Salinisphaera sp. Q1T1-3]|uniref:haloacid dehalogenase type II n=1 Tax=Salinisphaera sp. Q1T1-3 TaxID=2321229 RepID=UPI000E7369F3|nr:haloacid dehalogenase type II [Salinisphaera sp. Q1T1-3]RJS95227.1 haloacid dehalogenase type II [Salinisphaera sp. Q1T1-3]
MTTPSPHVLAFDVFGTVADWHGTIRDEITTREPAIDGAAFARRWRAGYRPAMDRVATGEWPWQSLDALHRRLLDDMLGDYGLDHWNEAARADFNRVWHRLDVWPDVPEGLARLRRDRICVTLSNGNIGLLTQQARHAGIHWDCILSAENFRRYKPDAATYLGVAEIFDCRPQEIMMVATHQNDLDAAAGFGLQTAYIERPQEFGADAPKTASAPGDNDCHARDLIDLASQLAS